MRQHSSLCPVVPASLEEMSTKVVTVCHQYGKQSKVRLSELPPGLDPTNMLSVLFPCSIDRSQSAQNKLFCMFRLKAEF